MTDNSCDLSKWRLFISFFERNKPFGYMVVGTCCAMFITSIYFVGPVMQIIAKEYISGKLCSLDK